MPTPPDSALNEKARVEDHNSILQQVLDEMEGEGKKKDKKKKKKHKWDNRIYSWRHYYTRPKWKDFEPDQKLADKLESAPPPPPRRFKDKTPGEVMLVLLREAHARGCLTDIRAGFTKERDSAGRPWSKKPKDLVNHKFKPKTTMLEVARWMAESDHAEARMDGRQLELYRPDSSEFKPDILLAPGKNIIEEPTKASHRERASHVFVQSESGVHGFVGDQKIRKKIGRRVEASLDIGPVKYWEAAEERGLAYLRRHGAPKHARVIKVPPDAGANPYKGKYKIGDEVLLMENGQTAPHRVRQIALNWETDGSAEINLVLSDKLIHREVKQHRRMRSLTGKTAMTSPALSQLFGSDTPTSDGEAPEPPSPPIVTVRNGVAEIYWDGKTESASDPVWDQRNVEVHIGVEEDFRTTDLTYHSSMSFAGTVTVNFPEYDTPYYAKFVAVDLGGDASGPSEEVVIRVPKVTADDIQPGAVGPDQLNPDLGIGTDGNVPSSAPANVRTMAGKGLIFVLWDNVINADPVTYNVYASETSGFTADASTLLTPTGANSPVSFKALPDGTPFTYFVPDPVTGEPTGEVKQYYFRVEVRDDDVDDLSLGPISAEVPGRMDQTQGGDVAFNSIIGNHLAGEVILGSMIATALAGAGIRLNPEALGIYKSDDSAKLYAPTNDEPMTINAEIIAQAATILGRLAVFGTDNQFMPGSVTTLRGSTQNPTTQPAVSGANYAVATLADDAFPQYKRGLAYTTGLFNVTNKALTSNVATLTIGSHTIMVGHTITVAGVDATFNGTYTVTAVGGTTVSYAKVAANVTSQAATGTVTASFHDHYFYGTTLGWSGQTCLGSSISEVTSAGSTVGAYQLLDATSDMVDAAGGITKLGTNWYALTYYKPDDEWWVYRYATPLTLTNVPTGAWQYTNEPNGDNPIIGNDGTNIMIARVNTSKEIVVRRFNPSTGAQVGTAVISNFTTGGGGANLAGIMSLTADMGEPLYVVVPESSGVYNENWWVINYDGHANPGNRRPNNEWPIAKGHTLSGACYNGTNFMHLNKGATDEDIGQLVTYSQNWWTTESATWWVSYTFRDSAGTPHETYQSPMRKLTMTKRGRLQVTTAAIPPGGGADDPDSVRIYVGRGGSAPADSAMWRAPSGSQPGVGLTVAFIALMVFSGSALTARDAVFPAGIAAQFKDDLSQVLLKSDGTTGVFYTGDMKPTVRAVSGGGAVIDFAWFKADFSEVNRITYGNLWAAMGSPDDGDGNTTYNLPDARGRALYGAGTDIALGSTDGKAVGSRGVVHVHNIPTHTHGINSGGGHNHGLTTNTDAQLGGSGRHVTTTTTQNDGAHDHGSNTLGGTAFDSGNSGANSIGYLGVNWLVKF